jgi:hypothetical protein
MPEDELRQRPDYLRLKAIQWRVRALRKAVREDRTWMQVARGYEALAASRVTLERTKISRQSERR